MTRKAWSTTYPVTLDTATNMPTLVNFVDQFDATHVNALRDAVIALETQTSSLVAGSSYLTTTPPTGMATQPAAVYQFDGTGNALKDRTANANDLSVNAGTARYTTHAGAVGFLFDGSTRLRSGSPRATLQITAELTLEVVLVPLDLNVSIGTIIGHGGNSELQAMNWLYLLDHVNTSAFGNYSATQLRAFHESGAGTNRTQTFVNGAIAKSQRTYLTLTRASDGVTHKLYKDGIYLETQTLAAAPDGGGTGWLWLGGTDDGAGGQWTAIFHSARVTAAEFSAAQVAEVYRSVAGS
jgi:hypothetical protein